MNGRRFVRAIAQERIDDWHPPRDAGKVGKKPDGHSDDPARHVALVAERVIADRPDFIVYFRDAKPIEELAHLAAGAGVISGASG